MTTNQHLWHIYQDAANGRLSRRSFIRRAATLGMATPVLLAALQSGVVGASAAGTAHAPNAGTAGQKRGSGGKLKIAQWQAPRFLAPVVPDNIDVSLGTNDYLAMSLVLEPLLHYSPAGELIPNLVTKIPSWENGLLAKDNTAVTYNLLPNVTWSDGAPFSADDVVFTWQWVSDSENGDARTSTYAPIANAEAVSPTQVKLTFKQPSPFWYEAFTGSYNGVVLPKHILANGNKDAYHKFSQHPVGTGPYTIASFKSNEQVQYVANTKYRELNKPAFSEVLLQGGGVGTAAAKAVIEKGDWDFAPMLDFTAAGLKSTPLDGMKGRLVAVPGTGVEQLLPNFSDPNKDVDGENSSLKAPHPFLTDKTVRQAISLAVDRKSIAADYFQPGQPVASNIIAGIPADASSNTSWEYNLAKANQLLDQAGWQKSGGVRANDGVSLNVKFSTTTNPLRQQEQLIIKQGLTAIGFKVTLVQVDAGEYFGALGNTPYPYIALEPVDLQMYTTNPIAPFPLSYMAAWYAGPNNENVPQKANKWTGTNMQRYSNPAYDKLYEAAAQEIDPTKSAELFIKMNDLLIDDVAVVPLVQRADQMIAVSHRLQLDNIAGSSFEPVFWNIANWTTTSSGTADIALQAARARAADATATPTN